VSILQDLCIYFLPTYNSGSLDLALGTNLFAGTLPDEPDDCVALLEYPGGPVDHVFGQGTPEQHKPRVQVVVRNTDYLTGRDQIDAVTTALESIVNQTINSVLYLRVEQQQDPFALHRDPARRFFFACNFECNRVQ
jgi:hypothetical protein